MPEKEFTTFKDILNNKQANTTKPTAYRWQELALQIIKELNIPPNKKSSVFKACKSNNKIFIERCLSDTKELCQSGDKWKYFFKLINQPKGENLVKDSQSQKDVHKKEASESD